MNLDDIDLMKNFDPDGVINHIRSIPEQIKAGWEAGLSVDPLFAPGTNFIVIGSIESMSFVSRLVRQWAVACSLPVLVSEDALFSVRSGRQDVTLILLADSGDEKELLYLFSQGLELGCRMLVLARGGQLVELAKNHEIPFKVYVYPNSGYIISSAWQFFFLVGILSKTDILHSHVPNINNIVESLKKTGELIDIEVPVVNNPAKRLAGQFLDRFVTLFASGFMESVAEHWKSQINLNAKAWAQVENIPRACTTTVAGMYQPENLLSQMMTLFLQSNYDDPSNMSLSNEMRRLFMVEGFNTDVYLSEGQSEEECMWNAILFGEFVSYYLAMAYGVNPSDNPGVVEMKDFASIQ